MLRDRCVAEIDICLLSSFQRTYIKKKDGEKIIYLFISFISSIISLNFVITRVEKRSKLGRKWDVCTRLYAACWDDLHGNDDTINPVVSRLELEPLYTTTTTPIHPLRSGGLFGFSPWFREIESIRPLENSARCHSPNFCFPPGSRLGLAEVNIIRPIPRDFVHTEDVVNTDNWKLKIPTSTCNSVDFLSIVRCKLLITQMWSFPVIIKQRRKMIDILRNNSIVKYLW